MGQNQYPPRYNYDDPRGHDYYPSNYGPPRKYNAPNLYRGGRPDFRDEDPRGPPRYQDREFDPRPMRGGEFRGGAGPERGGMRGRGGPPRERQMNTPDEDRAEIPEQRVLRGHRGRGDFRGRGDGMARGDVHEERGRGDFRGRGDRGGYRGDRGGFRGDRGGDRGRGGMRGRDDQESPRERAILHRRPQRGGINDDE